MADRRERALAYIKANGENLQNTLSQVLNSAIAANAADPLVFIAEEVRAQELRPDQPHHT